MRRVWINVYQIENRVIVEKRDERNISIVINIFAESKAQQREVDVNISGDSRRVISMSWISREYGSVRMIGDFYKFFLFKANWIWNRLYIGPRWLLDEYDVKRELCFKNGVDDKIILVNVLREDTNVL